MTTVRYPEVALLGFTSHQEPDTPVLVPPHVPPADLVPPMTQAQRRAGSTCVTVDNDERTVLIERVPAPLLAAAVPVHAPRSAAAWWGTLHLWVSTAEQDPGGSTLPVAWVALLFPKAAVCRVDAEEDPFHPARYSLEFSFTAAVAQPLPYAALPDGIPAHPVTHVLYPQAATDLPVPTFTSVPGA